MISLGIVIFSFLAMIFHFPIFSLFSFLLGGSSLFFLKEQKEEEEEEEISLEETPEHVIEFPKEFDKKKFVKKIFLLYRGIQADFMNFDYDSLMDKLGLEMYQQFHHQMKHLEENGSQAVRRNIELEKFQVSYFKEEPELTKAMVELTVLEDKYTKKLEEPFRLTSSKVRYESSYLLTIVINHKKRIVRKCAYCSAKLHGNPFKCPECDSLLLENTEEWILKDMKLLCSKSYVEKKDE